MQSISEYGETIRIAMERLIWKRKNNVSRAKDSAEKGPASENHEKETFYSGSTYKFISHSHYLVDWFPF